MNQRDAGRQTFAACLAAEDAARLLGFPLYYLPMLVRARHLKPLGKPAQNSRKWFARVELEALALDRNWLDKAVLIVERTVRVWNCAQRGHKQDVDLPGRETAQEVTPA